MTLYRVRYTGLQCERETDEIGSDEIYAVFLVVSWAQDPSAPILKVRHTRTYEGVGQGDVLGVGDSDDDVILWGDGEAEPLTLHNTLFLMQAMESDEDQF